MSKLLLSFIIATLLLAGCLSPVAAPNALAPVNVCYVKGASSQVAGLYAFEKGLFQKHGLQVKLIAMESGSKAATALIAGDLDICLMSGTSIINGVAAGADPVMIGGLINTYIYSLMVTPEIQTPADLKGKVLATNQAGGATDVAIRATLKHFGLQPDVDVMLLAAGSQGERLVAMEAGQAVGTIVTVPESVQATKKGFHQLFDVASLQMPVSYVTVSSTRSYLAANRSLALAFMRAISESVAAMKKDKPGTIEVLAKYLLLDVTTDADSLNEAYAVLVNKYMSTVPYPTIEGIQAEIEILKVENPQVATLDPETVVDMSLVRELEESGWFKQLYE